MVGKRDFAAGNGFTDVVEQAAGKRSRDGDSKPRPRPKIFRFQDAVNAATEDAGREELKKKLLSGADREGWEQFRKSKDEVRILNRRGTPCNMSLTRSQLKEISNKKVRKFYENQNERLNDWLEVDTVVTAIADDVFDSYHPDRDNDGIAEREGGLDQVHEDVEALLPEEERTQRQKDEKRAKWAINVGPFDDEYTSGNTLLTGFSATDQRHCQHYPSCCQDRGRFFLIVPVAHRVPCRLRSRPAVHADRVDDEQTCQLETECTAQEISSW